MEYDYLEQLDEFFAAQYADYVKIAATEGYRMPEMLSVGADGNIVRKDQKYLRFCYQEHAAETLRNFKAGLCDTGFTFNFRFPTLRERIGDIFSKHTFAKLLPAILKKYSVTADELGARLSLDPKIWHGIVKGKYYPEKNTVMAAALVCRMQTEDVRTLFGVCGFELKQDDVRDVVFDYLVTQKIFNPEMRDRCLGEYRIDTIPIAEGA